MQRFLPILFLFFSLSGLTTLMAQEIYPGCEGDRYREIQFLEATVTTGVQFGENTTIAGNNKELFMDIYEPMDDAQEERPVIVMAFGGSFISGVREDLDGICRALASHGFVAVTIDYRLYDLPLLPLPTPDEMTEVVVQARADYKAAIRYLRADAANDNLYRIDADQIFIGGVSAGAIAALHTAVMDETDEVEQSILDLIEGEGGFEGSSNDLEYSSEVQGIVNLSGALQNAAWIDAEDPPFVSVHDEFDAVVPYNTGFATVLGVTLNYLEGSNVMKARGDELGITNDLWTLEGSFGHVTYFGTDESSIATLDFVTDFVADLLCGTSVNTTEADAALATIEAAPNPARSGQLLQLNGAKGQTLTATLFSATGQTLLRTFLRDGELQLPPLSSGLYFLQLQDEATGGLAIQRVVIQ